MAKFSLSGPTIRGLAAAVPQQEVLTENSVLLSEAEKRSFIKRVGIGKRRIAPLEMTAADLCEQAAVCLLDRLEWGRDEVKVLCLVTQTPDYLTPCTATILQDRLGLSKECLCFDINLGCSAFPYGLATVANFLQAMPGGKGLLLIGDKSSQLVSPTDKSTALLFSDAGAAIAMENDGSTSPMHFALYSDGSGFQSLMVPGGGGRQPAKPESLVVQTVSDGIERHDLNLQMNGIDIFNFALRQVAPSLKQFLQERAVGPEEIDYLILHQANKIINDSMRKMVGFPEEKCPSVLHQFGNPSSASIPFTIVNRLGEQLQRGRHRLLLSGFGVGLSWGNVLVEVNDLPYIPLLEL